MRRPTVLRPACLAALATVVGLPGVGTLPAAADASDGTLTVTVAVDRDGSGAYLPEVDGRQPGVQVTVTDAGGQAVSGVTDDGGQFVVEPTSELSGGRYFVTAKLPDELDLSPAPPSDGFAPFSSTVDVTTGSQSVVLGVLPRPAAGPAPTEPVPPRPTSPQREAAVPAPRSAVVAPANPRFAVGDRVWHDRDGGGRQDDGEPGVAGISVQLLDGDGTVLASTTSDATGRYLFDDLPAGTYAVRFAGLPSGLKLSPAGVGGGASDSDPDYTGVTPPFTLGRGEPDLRPPSGADDVRADYLHAGIDAGVAPLRFAIASVVWQDDNTDGLLDQAEPAGRARVVLLRGSRGEEVVATTVTDDQGRYRFVGLSEGRYRVRFVDLGTHRRLTQPRAGTNRAVDSAPDPDTATSETVELVQGGADLVPGSDLDIDADFVLVGLNAGTVGSYAITNRVWRDLNEDGLLNPGEPGVRGVRVELLELGGTVVATTTTAASGRYTFSELPAGRYQLRLPALPAGLHFTMPRTGADAAADSDVYGNALTAPIAVGEDNPVETQVAAGLSRSASAAAGTVAPDSTSSPATVAAPQAAVVDERPSQLGALLAVALGGLLLVMVGSAAVVYARLRRTR